MQACAGREGVGGGAGRRLTEMVAASTLIPSLLTSTAVTPPSCSEGRKQSTSVTSCSIQRDSTVTNSVPTY